MPIKSIERLTDGGGEEIGIRLHGAGRGISEVLYADVAGKPWNAARLERFRSQMQDEIDDPIPLSRGDFVDDPDALLDPSRPDLFHKDGNLVGRSVIISDVTHDGTRMQFTLTKASPPRAVPQT